MTNQKKKLDRKEVFISLILFLVIWVFLSWILYFYNIKHQYGDGTFAAQAFYNFRQRFTLTSSFAASVLESMRTIWYKPADYVCSQPLILTLVDKPLWFHFYFVAYLFIPLARLFDIHSLIAITHAFIYSSILLFSYFYARDRKINILNSLLLIILVIQHPLWRMGLFGQEIL